MVDRAQIHTTAQRIPPVADRGTPSFLVFVVVGKGERSRPVIIRKAYTMHLFLL